MKVHGFVQAVYADLFELYGPQHWWPARDSFEVAVGAVLTQNTAWRNVEKAIRNLKRQGCLTAEGIAARPIHELAELIRPSGYYNVKARRLMALTRWWLAESNSAGSRSADLLRDALLGVHGIGPETADCILLYAFKQPVFIVDAYARRLFARMGHIAGNEPYELIRQAIECGVDRDPLILNEYHALIVTHAKNYCRKLPLCDTCGLTSGCARGAGPGG